MASILSRPQLVNLIPGSLIAVSHLLCRSPWTDVGDLAVLSHVVPHLHLQQYEFRLLYGHLGQHPPEAFRPGNRRRWSNIWRHPDRLQHWLASRAHSGTGKLNWLTQNCRHFADDIFKCISLNENMWISLKISLKFVPKDRINNIPALVQIMAWRRPGDKPLSEPVMVSLLTHICVIRRQWVDYCSWENWV